MLNLRIPAKKFATFEARELSLFEKINKLTNITRQEKLSAVMTEKPDFEIVEDYDDST